MKRIFVAGYYGFGNTGDEAILASMIASLRAIEPDVQFIATTADAERTAKLHGIEAVLWTDIGALAEAVRTSDLVLIGGGGIFHDYWGFDANAFLTPNHSGIGFYTGPAVLGRLYRKPVMLYGIGVGPLPSPHGERFTRVACECAQIVTVRDEASRDLLVQIGVPAEKITVTADPVWAWRHSATRSREAEGQGRELRIGVSVRHWDAGVHPAFWEAELAAALDHVLASEPAASVLFVPFQEHSGERENDFAVAERVRERMKRGARAQVLEAGLPPAELAEQLAACDVVVGMRLHSLIFAASAGVPVVGLEYDGKVREVMRQLGAGSRNLPLCALEAPGAADLLRRVITSREALAIDSRAVSARLRAIAQGAADLAGGLLASKTPIFASCSPDLEAVLARAVGALISDSGQWRAESQRLFTLADSQIRKAQALAAETAEIRAQWEQQQVELRRQQVEFEQQQQAELQRQQFKAREASRRAEESARLAAESQQQAREAKAAQASIQAEAAALKAENARLASGQRELERAEQHRQRVLAGIDKFRLELEVQRQSYRDQRAYQVMLLLRKAYILLLRSGIRGTLQFIPWLLNKRNWNLAEVDLTLPEVWTYLPHGLETPYNRALPPPVATRDQATDQPMFNGIAHPGKYDVVILAVFNFEFRYQRPQQIATQFARSGHRVFWVSPGRLLPPTAEDAYEALLLQENLWEIHMRTSPIELYTGELKDDHARSIMYCLSGLFRDFHIAESCALLQFPYWARTGFDLREKYGTRVIYDCMDDWQNWTTEPVISKFNLDEEKRLAREGDVVVVTSQDLHERFAKLGAQPVLARNGADYDFFSSPRENTFLDDIPKPLIGYYGAIADWFDLQLIYEVVKSRPQYNFGFIGHVYKLDISELVKLPNVRMLGEKNYRDLPMYLQKFDVCLVPFVLNELTKAVDPVKMYEYLSQGKPVVATDMAELAQLEGDVVYIGRNAQDFAAKIDQALAEKDDPELIRRRVEFAKANTWAKRVEPIDDAICATYRKVSVLIVTYNCEEFLAPCLDSIERNTAYPDYEVVIVDNASNEATRAIVKRYAAANPRIRINLLDYNAGFAGANNIAAREATGEYLVFLNPDTIVTPGWLNRMTNHFRRDPNVGLVCAVTNFSGNETKINFQYGSLAEMEEFALALAQEKNGQALDVRVVPLFAVMTKTELWKQVGELDESFEVGMFEDDDFSMRFREAGYRVVTAEDCFIHHFGNGSFAKLPSHESVRIFERNRERFEKKWGCAWQPHRLRDGVRAPYDDRRFHPLEFVANGTAKVRQQDNRLVLTELYPSTCPAGEGFNVQPVTGYSAIAVDCVNATPSTVIAISGLVLHTNYGGQKRLTGLVPPAVYAEPGVKEVYLVNDFGESNRLLFTITPAVVEAREATSGS